MHNNLVAIAVLLPALAVAEPQLTAPRLWTYSHVATPGVAGQSAEIPAYDAATNTIWVAGGAGVDVLDARTGVLRRHLSTRASGTVNSVAINDGVAALAIEHGVARSRPGEVRFYDTRTLAPTGSVTVGAQPDMLTFTPDGSRLLVANEGTPDRYGRRLGRDVPYRFAPAADDPPGSVSIIDMASRTVRATAGLAGVADTGSHLRRQTGMDFEPEYIAVTADGSKAFVSLQEANGVAVLDLASQRFERIIGLGVKDFSQPGNGLDGRADGRLTFDGPAVKGYYMPDSLATYEAGGQTYIVMANEGDFREDDGDRSSAGAAEFATDGVPGQLRIVNTGSSAGDVYVAGTRSFSIRASDGRLVYDSGELLERLAFAHGIRDDARSRDKGVEPEGVAVLGIGQRTLAFIGLERTRDSAVAVFDITDPQRVGYLALLVSAGERAPEGLLAYRHGGEHFLVVANEESRSVSLFRLTLSP
jgi:hypothetical protein